MSTSTDGGYSISGGFDMGAGSLVDVADKEPDAQSGVVGAPKSQSQKTQHSSSSAGCN